MNREAVSLMSCSADHVEPSPAVFSNQTVLAVDGKTAITSTSLVAGSTPEERFERIRALYSRCAGRELSLDENVYASEARTGHRNRAIGHMLRYLRISRGGRLAECRALTSSARYVGRCIAGTTKTSAIPGLARSPSQ